MNNAIRSQINYFISQFTDIQANYEKLLEDSNTAKKRVPSMGYRNITHIAKEIVGGVVLSHDKINMLNNRFNDISYQTKLYLQSLMIGGKSGQKYADILDSEVLSGTNLIEKTKAAVKQLKIILKNDLIYINDYSASKQPKPARNISISENIKHAKEDINNL